MRAPVTARTSLRSSPGHLELAGRDLRRDLSNNGYDDADGFLEFYGDYGEIAITNEGKTVATWGEGFSWLAPGNVWVNVQT